MLKNKVIFKNWMVSCFVILLMLLTGFVGMAAAAEDNTDPSNNENSETAASIIGKVVNAEGEVLVGVQVVLMGVPNDDPQEIPMFERETNERGIFDFGNLRRGLYTIEAWLEGYEGWFDEIKVPAEETVELKIILEKIEEPEDDVEEPCWGVVFGGVFNALENEPIVGAFILIHNLETDREPIKTETNEQGQFKVRVPCGELVIVCEARGFYPFKEVYLVKPEAELEIKIMLRPCEVDDEKEYERPMLCGRIFDAKTDKPIFGWVELSQGNPQLQVQKRPEDGNIEDDIDTDPDAEDQMMRKKLELREQEEQKQREKKDQDQPPTRCGPGNENCDGRQPLDYRLWRIYTNDDGFYEYFHLPPGHYVMRAFAKGHVMYYNEINIEDEPMYIDVYLMRERAPPVPPQPMSFIGGRVVDASSREPVAGAIVCVVSPKMLERLRENPESTDLDFDIDLENINFDGEMNIEYSDIPKTRSTDPDRPGIPEGDPKNENRPEFKPELCKNQPQPLRFCTKTDENGLFRLKVQPGAYVLIIKARGYQPVGRRFTIEPFRKIDVKIPLQQAGEQEPIRDSNNKLGEEQDEPESVSAVGSSAAMGAAASTSILSGIFVVLLVIAMTLAAIIWRRRNLAVKPKKKI